MHVPRNLDGLGTPTRWRRQHGRRKMATTTARTSTPAHPPARWIHSKTTRSQDFLIIYDGSMPAGCTEEERFAKTPYPSSLLTKLRLPVLWIKLGAWPPRGWKYSAISLCNLIFSSCATPSPRCGCLGLSVPPPPPPLLPLLGPDDLPLLLHPMLSPKLLPLMSETEDLASY
jgi:hypothetical protein